MLNITRLEVDRQINAGKAIGPILAAPRQTSLHPGTMTRGDAVISATLALIAARDTPPRLVDHATDSVTAAFDRGLETREQVLRDTVVPLGAAQRLTLGHIRLLRTRLFPQGTGFIRLTMDLQWRHLDELRSRMGEPEVRAAIDGLGLRPEADHLLAHIERYGRALGQDAGAARRSTELASEAWHEAFRRFAAQVLIDYDGQPAMQQELLGPYEAQLEQQRAATRARRARAEGQDGSPPAANGTPRTG